MSDPDDVDRLEELFARARELPADERAAFVERECGDDVELRTLLETLLAQEDDDLPEGRALPPDELFGAGPATPRPGTRLGGYDLLAELGQGGMGVVYRARRPATEEEVALKVLRPSHLLATGPAERFAREIKALQDLDHPGIVQLLDVGEDQGTRFYAMELVEGNDLADELALLREEATRRGVDSTQLTIRGKDTYVRTVVRIVRDAAAALQFAHDRGFLHRDIKPSNLLLDRRGEVRLVDFGLARDLSAATVTGEGELAGSAAYMSPEQAAGKLHEEVDRRSDVYSLGVVLYELLTLQRPHEGRTERELLEAIQDVEPRPLRDRNPRLPRDLEAIVATAMAKRPEERYGSAAEFFDDLDRVLRSESVRARLPTLWVRTLRWTRRHRRGVAAAGLTALVVWVAYAVGQAAERQAEADQRASALSEAPEFAGDGLPDPAALAPARRLELHRACEDVLADPSLHDTSVVDQARRYEAGLAAYRDARKAELQGLQVGLAGPGGDGVLEGAMALRVALEAAELAALFPEDDPLAGLADPRALMPRLRVDVRDVLGNPLDALVSVRPIDLVSTQPGPRRDLGTSPVEEALLPGLYRVLVRFDDGALQEFSCSLTEVGARSLIEVRRQPWPDDRTTDMVRFDGATFSVPTEAKAVSHLQGETVTVEPFWLDRHEVSNADYLEFLAVHPAARLPKFWQDERPAGWERLPVTGLSWDEMQRYAEWRGKRLPTLAEWTWAARGAAMRPYAWPSDLGGPPACFVYDEDHQPQSEQQGWELYLRHARPVDACPEAASPEGLHFLYGNVNEFTESVWVQRRADGSWTPFLDQRVLAGKSWRVWFPDEDLRFQGYTRTDRASAQEDLGFRLALSAEL